MSPVTSHRAETARASVRIRAAGFWPRLLAFSLDAFLLLPVTVAVGLALRVIDLAALPARQGNLIDYLADLWNTAPSTVTNPLLLLLVVLFLYDAIMTALWGTSPGRRVLQIRLFDRHGRAPRLLRALLRSVVRMVSLLLLGIGCFWSAAHKERRTWHDLVAGTWSGRVERATGRSRSDT